MIDEEKHREWTALSRTVLVVASANRKVGDWSAYIDSVPGENHSEEWEKVLIEGTKLPYDVARVLFPYFDENYQWRD